MNKNKLKKLVAITGITLVFTMFVLKVVAYSYSGSVSVLASLIDSGADFFTTIITLIAIFAAVRPADKNHHFGHGKAESLGALFQSIFIFISAFFLIWQAVNHTLHGYEANIDSITIGIMLISLMLTLLLVIFQRHVIRKTKSIAIKADNVNYTADIFTTIGVLLSLLITKYMNINYVDAIFGVCIALFLCKNAKGLMAESLDVLMDREIPQEIKNKVKKEIRNHPDVLGYHKFRSRYCGQRYFVEFHLELNETISLKKALKIYHDLKKEILKIIPNADITIHQDIPK